ncbi:NAD(P)/FAD-dependent oxidoreductase [Pedobacter sp. N36a]|uniref:NAD(P)/FAD-dependent oxidoreductase n=1 Tax=Pedobacter sp. N36a TaxID=2767996 RepID=UPI0016574263|nr:NAD(P)/FAD-dependent oxidoreductase [Pedobacter sp. N36a]MBC8984428.1 NAD(P)/FAD-dependent oxidoreductase [Pedobacter sp. N36a]
MESKVEVLIIGAGLSGLTAALHFLKSGFPVTLVEKASYPHHKVCGEYLSNEVLPYLEWLGVDLNLLSPVSIHQFQFSTNDGQLLQTTLPLGGLGISRYALDHFLFQEAIARGCHILQDTVVDLSFKEDLFLVKMANHAPITAKIVIGAYGKRDGLDQKLSRSFMQKKSPWLAIKAHYEGSFPDDLVGLHNFEGGYCGVSKVENNKINICYLVEYASFKKYRSIPEHRLQVLYKNPHLRKIFDDCKLLFDQPLAIGQISFEKKSILENHVLMIGDTAGLIHPFCGNGMAMAIHSAKLCASSVIDYLEGKSSSRTQLEKQYRSLWNQHFLSRITAGKVMSGILRKKQLTRRFMRILIKYPFLLSMMIKQTHGKPIIP